MFIVSLVLSLERKKTAIKKYKCAKTSHVQKASQAQGKISWLINANGTTYIDLCFYKAVVNILLHS